MPLYEYQCDSCGHRFERIQKFSDPPVSSCPKCGSSVHKLVSSPAFHLKGTGWYATDYAKKSGSGASESASSESKDTSSKDAKTTGDTKDSASKSPTDSTSKESSSSTTPAASSAKPT